jgi:hypothetical protein
VIADGPPRRVLDVAGEGMIELAFPDLVLAELERVMTEKLELGPERFQRLQACSTSSRPAGLRRRRAPMRSLGTPATIGSSRRRSQPMPTCS